MLYDFPTPPMTLTSNYTQTTSTSTPQSNALYNINAEIIMQLNFDKVAKWGKWKFKFSALKSSVVFTRAYNTGEDPLLFLNGQRIPNAKKFNCPPPLGVTMDTKLLWKDHIAVVINNCVKIKMPPSSPNLYTHPLSKPFPLYSKALKEAGSTTASSSTDQLANLTSFKLTSQPDQSLGLSWVQGLHPYQSNLCRNRDRTSIR